MLPCTTRLVGYTGPLPEEPAKIIPPGWAIPPPPCGIGWYPKLMGAWPCPKRPNLCPDATGPSNSVGSTTAFPSGDALNAIVAELVAFAR